MLVGGLNSMDKVSLYNIETQEQCELSSSPFFSYGSVGVSLNQVSSRQLDEEFLLG